MATRPYARVDLRNGSIIDLTLDDHEKFLDVKNLDGTTVLRLRRSDVEEFAYGLLYLSKKMREG
jgi:hypothetical protein